MRKILTGTDFVPIFLSMGACRQFVVKVHKELL